MIRIPLLIRDVCGRTRPRDLPGRIITYAGLWWLITGGDPASWSWGVPAIVAAAVINPFPMAGRWRVSAGGMLIFALTFIGFSLRSATDVALRALLPLQLLTPALLEYTWRLPPNGSRIFLANLINLMPGTLCVRITDNAMTVHTIGDTARTLAALERLEELTGALLKQPLAHHYRDGP